MSEKTCLHEYVNMAKTMADAVRPIIKKHFRTRLDVIAKSDDSPVTIADRDAETEMRRIIRETYPDHGIRGEEFGCENLDADWCWVLDPIDGTKSFVSGSLCFGTQIGLAYRGAPMLGIIDQPITGERWIGVAGERSTLGSAPISTSKTEDIAQAVIYTSAVEQFSEDQKSAFTQLSGASNFTRYSHDCYAAGLLAIGMVDVLIEANVYDYDIVPQIPIIEGAGGLITDWRGNKLGRGPKFESVLVAANPTLHAKAIELLSVRCGYS